MLENDFYRWEKLIEQRVGIQLPDAQQDIFRNQVVRRMGELGIDDGSAYFDLIQGGVNGAAEWQILVDRLVVKDTRFFRNRPSLKLVEDYVTHKLRHWNGNSLEIWSVGCSTGEEPYALAGIVDDCFHHAQCYPYYGVTAIDISLSALAIARKGIYNLRSLSLLTDIERAHYFSSLKNNRFEVKKSLQERVCFSQYNILQLRDKPIQAMDIIFCQNVLIYFRRWRRREILGQLAKNLKPGGLLIIGPGEVTDWKPDDLQVVDREEVQAYERPLEN